ncbi:MAG: chemotaxis protein CheW [Ignavibacteriaceae bacterium]
MEMAKNKNNDVTDILQLVGFKMGNEEFGIDILNVKEINRMVNITKLPNSPVFVEGIINLRGKVIPVVDLRTKLGMPKKEADKDTRIVVVDIDGRTVGFLVDAVSEVLRIPGNITEAPPEITTGVNSEYITAVAKLEDRLLTLLDLNKVLMKEEKRVLETVN